MHLLVGELKAEMRGVHDALKQLHEDFQCVPERLTSLEEWKARWDARSQRFAAAKWTVGGSVVLLALNKVWDWLHHLFAGGGPRS